LNNILPDDGKRKKAVVWRKQYSLQGAGGTASGAAEYTNAYRSSDSISKYGSIPTFSGQVRLDA